MELSFVGAKARSLGSQGANLDNCPDPLKDKKKMNPLSLSFRNVVMELFFFFFFFFFREGRGGGVIF